MMVNCRWCGKKFKIKPSKLKERNFCSRECYHEYQGRNMIKTTCYRCGKPVSKPPSKKSERTFCSRSCHMKTMNEELNPDRMTLSTRTKLRKARLGKGNGKAYKKLYGRHEHRVVAELKLGRSLDNEEVVHHIDGDKRNNDPENLLVFQSQSDHLKWHLEHDRRY